MAEKKSFSLSQMVTEQANPNSMNLDLMSVSEILHTINDEDKNCALAVEKVLPLIEEIVNHVVDRFGRGGRILYMGAGTSGRVAIMDAAEFSPTFGVDAQRVQARIAGGNTSVTKPQEQREDNISEGAQTVLEWNPTELDCVIGLATSGKTPYVISGLKAARDAGAFTAFICANPASSDIADVVVPSITGPEVLTGSTRMKAGTAQKMILNMISTATMVRLGRTYKNRMSHIAAGNVKLYSRALETLVMCSDISEDEAKRILEAADFELPTALVASIGKCDIKTARNMLSESNGKVRAAIELLGRELL